MYSSYITVYTLIRQLCLPDLLESKHCKANIMTDGMSGLQN